MYLCPPRSYLNGLPPKMRQAWGHCPDRVSFTTAKASRNRPSVQGPPSCRTYYTPSATKTVFGRGSLKTPYAFQRKVIRWKCVRNYIHYFEERLGKYHANVQHHSESPFGSRNEAIAGMVSNLGGLARWKEYMLIML